MSHRDCLCRCECHDPSIEDPAPHIPGCAYTDPSYEPRVTLSKAAANAIETYLAHARNLHEWDKANPMPAFERAQETHKVERIAEAMKVAEAEKNMVAELERDARGR